MRSIAPEPLFALCFLPPICLHSKTNNAVAKRDAQGTNYAISALWETPKHTSGTGISAPAKAMRFIDGPPFMRTKRVTVKQEDLRRVLDAASKFMKR